MKDAKICAFDVNETLLDLSVLDPWFLEVFGKTEYRQLWFKTVLNTAWVLTLSNSYQDFKTIGEATLCSLAAQFNRQLSSEQKHAYTTILKTLPVHPDVEEGLKILKAAGYRIVALTNSSRESATQSLTKSKVMDYFETCYSTDAVKQFKPSAAPYEWVAQDLKVPIECVWLIAAHAWDTNGAKKAGAKSALVLRPGHGQNELFAKPDVQAVDLPSIAREIITKDESLNLTKKAHNTHV